jgi:hypothetical protein
LSEGRRRLSREQEIESRKEVVEQSARNRKHEEKIKQIAGGRS